MCSIHRKGHLPTTFLALRNNDIKHRTGWYMEELNPHSLQMEAIQRDLNQIVAEWLHLHFHITAILVFLSFLTECVMAFFIAHSDILTTTISRYILKFIVVPSGLAGLCLLVGLLFLRSKSLSQQVKIYAVSLTYVLICFVYYTAHSAFVATYALFPVAIFLTTTYANHRLTGTVSLVSIASLVISELFIRWDLDKTSIFDDPNRLVTFLIAISVLLGSYLISSVTIVFERRKNEVSLRREVEREQLKESIQYDVLTGIYNRKALHDALRLLEQQGSAEPLIFGIADIDHFKEVNDRFGHRVGDLCLIEFARALSEYFGESSVYRYGGDEFCLILRKVTIETAISLSERVQSRLERVELSDAPALKPTVSFGFSSLSAEDDASRLFNQADEALYEAKRVRNAIRIYSSSLTQHQMHIETLP